MKGGANPHDIISGFHLDKRNAVLIILAQWSRSLFGEKQQKRKKKVFTSNEFVVDGKVKTIQMQKKLFLSPLRLVSKRCSLKNF
jgi:hypothetical protein